MFSWNTGYKLKYLIKSNVLYYICYFSEMCRCTRKTTICIYENKDADQHICFRYTDSTIPIQNLKLLACFCYCTDRFVSDLVGNSNCCFRGSYNFMNSTSYIELEDELYDCMNGVMTPLRPFCSIVLSNSEQNPTENFELQRHTGRSISFVKSNMPYNHVISFNYETVCGIIS